MYFPTVWLFTAIVMACGINDMVEAQYGFPIYYRIARRYDGENQVIQAIEDKRHRDGTLQIGRPCPSKDCRVPPLTQPNDYDRIVTKPIHRRSPRPTSWRVDDTEDKETWSEKQALIQQLLLDRLE